MENLWSFQDCNLKVNEPNFTYLSMLQKIIFALLLCLIINCNAICQYQKTIYFCIQPAQTEQLSYTLLKSNRIIVTKKVLVSDSCFSIKIDNHGVFQLLVESVCCGIISKYWKADTLKSNQVFMIELKEKVIELKEITIKTGNRIQQRGDTLIIKTADVQTRPHADASALFNKIPGLEVGLGGGVRIFGKNVQEITIDGKKIFGGVPSITLNSLRSDMIEQMEFVEKKLANGQSTSQLNLRLKSNRKNGGYGDLSTGYGNSNNYFLGGHYNKISGNSFTNSYLTANSLNEKGINTKDIERMLFNSFSNSLNGASSIIGLYDNQQKLDEKDARFLMQGLLGTNKFLNGGGNYTFTGKKSNFDTFVVFNKSNQNLNQEQVTKSFLNDETQLQNKDKTQVSNLHSLSIGINGKIELNNRFTLRVADQFGTNASRIILFDTTISKINQNQGYSLYSYQKNNSEEWKNNFQISLNRKGRKKGMVSSIYVNLFNELPQEKLNINNSLTTSIGNGIHFFLIQKTINNNSFHLQGVQSLPLSKHFLIEAKGNITSENYDIIQNSFPLNFKIKNEGMSGNILINDVRQELATYLLYQYAKLTITTGISYWNWTSKRTKNNYNNSYHQNLLRIPMSKIEYRFSTRSSISLYYHNNPKFTGFRNLNSIPDSSNLSNFSVGNLSLRPYFEKNIGLLNKFVVGNGFNLSITLNYNHYLNYIISEQNFSNNTSFVSSSYSTSEKPVESLAINFFALKIGINRKLTWAMFGNFNRLKSYIRVNSVLLKLETDLLFSSQSLKWNISDKFSFQSDWNMQLTRTKNSINIYNTVLAKSEYELGKEWYLNFLFKTILTTNSIGRKSYQPFFDGEISKYLFKNNALCTSLVVKNIFNLENEAIISQNNNQQSIQFNSYLPRVLLLKLTLYPETWKK